MSQLCLPALVLITMGTNITFSRPLDLVQDDAIIALERAALDRWGRGDPEGYVSHGRLPNGAATVTRWNSTAVYGQIDGRWKILHSHWSFTKPELTAPNAP